MKNKVELKKKLILIIVVFFVVLAMFIACNYMQYIKYSKVFNEKINLIVANVKKEYPEVEISEAIDILNEEENTDNSILRDYGIDIESENVILENNKHFKTYLSLNIAIFAISFISVVSIFLWYNKGKDKELKEITKYIKEINKRNYKLDIEDNTEDELSILKNEIYKTTVMLKEVAENSKEDKIKLKASLSDISHQLKTPLTSITIMLDNMLDNKNMDEKERISFIKDIKREVINLNFLVQSLLKLSKLDSNTISFINKEEKLEEILKEAVKNIEGICDLKSIKINIDGNDTDTINCDFKWQVEAITNILKNCVEYSKENSEIFVKYSKNKMYTKIEIRDYGIGIDEEELPHIFERFHKGKNATSDSVGIGLALAKSIIEENNRIY